MNQIKVTKGPLRNVTKDHWKGYPVEVRPDGVEILSICALLGVQTGPTEAYEAALAKCGKDDTHVEVERWQYGVAPRCRKPDWHCVESRRIPSVEVVKVKCAS